MEEKPSIDYSKIVSNVGLDKKLYKELIETVRDNYAVKLQELKTHIENRDIQSIHIVAHSLKSGFGTIGATKASYLASKLENVIKDFEIQGIYNLFEQINCEFSNLNKIFSNSEWEKDFDKNVFNEKSNIKFLIAEDDLVNRHLLKTQLEYHAVCEIAVNGNEAISLFQKALEEGAPYKLVCLDIMMPGLDGQQVLKNIRSIEAEKGIRGLDGVKIIMTTALGNTDNITKAFRQQCDAYLVKPISKLKLTETLKSLGII
jgi:two-component system, chemotaxis family, chemotaxis protein CheY